MFCAVLITFNNSGFPCGGQRFSPKGKGRTLWAGLAGGYIKWVSREDPNVDTVNRHQPMTAA